MLKFVNTFASQRDVRIDVVFLKRVNRDPRQDPLPLQIMYLAGLAMSRYASIKEEEAQKCKDELLVLWTDFFKPQHVDNHPDLHQTFWMAAKLCSACKVEVSPTHAQELMDAIEEIHHLFWGVKGREVPWIRAS